MTELQTFKLKSIANHFYKSEMVHFNLTVYKLSGYKTTITILGKYRRVYINEV